MNKTFKIISLSLISVLYCVIISFYSSIAFIASFEIANGTTIHHEQCSSIRASNQPYHAEKSESSTPIFTTLRSAPNAYPFRDFSAFIQAEEKLFFNTFSQYSFYAKNGVVRLVYSILLFPFHFFW